MFWGIIIGLLVGYFFKPQIDGLVHKAAKYLKDNRKDKDSDSDY